MESFKKFIQGLGETEEESSSSAMFRDIVTSVVRKDISNSSDSYNIEIGKEMLRSLPWINDPELSAVRLQAMEAIAGLAITHFQDTNELPALRLSIQLLDDILKEKDKHDDATISRLYQLYSEALYWRYIRTFSNADVDGAIKMAKDAIQRTHPDTENDVEDLLVKRKLALWKYLFTRARISGDEQVAYVDQMIEVAEEIATFARNLRTTDPTWLEAMNNLGLSYQVRWDLKSDFTAPWDLEESIELGLDVCDALQTQENNADARVQAFSNLAFRLMRGFNCLLHGGKLRRDPRITTKENLGEVALKKIALSMQPKGVRRIHSKLENAVTFMDYFKNLPKPERGPLLAMSNDFLSTCVETMREVALLSCRDDQLDCLKTFYGLPRYAAAAVLEAGGTPYEALKVLEEGRGITLSIQFDTNQLDKETWTDEKSAEYLAYCEAKTKFLQKVASNGRLDERDNLLKELNSFKKSIQELAELTSVPSEIEVKKLAADRTIVVVSITDIRSDAIIISASSISAILLPKLDEENLSVSSVELQELLSLGNNNIAHSKTRQKLVTLLKQLWECLVKPVLTQLGFNEPHAEGTLWPQICWVPTGILSLYPIHAAEKPSFRLPDSEVTMLRVVSSYAPSLKILQRLQRLQQRTQELTRHRLNVAYNDQKTLIGTISMSDTPGPPGKKPSFLHSDNEVALVRKYYPMPRILAEDLDLKTPKYKDAIALLNRGLDVVHFSCHGVVDYEEPLDSRLLLEDWETQPLTLRDLLPLDLPSSKLAFLSACFTAHGGIESIQDEEDHLACGLLLAGFSNVVGSLWYVGEERAYDVAEGFYGTLASARKPLTSRAVAEALHFSVLELREKTKNSGNKFQGDPVYWAPFVHLGV